MKVRSNILSSHCILYLMMLTLFIAFPVLTNAQDAAKVWWPNISDANGVLGGEEVNWSSVYSDGNVTGDSMRVYEEGNSAGAIVQSGTGTYLRRDGSWGIGGNAENDPDAGARAMRISWQENAIYPGEAAVGWPLNNNDVIENVYFQFKATPDAGYALNASSVSFDMGRGDDHPIKAKAFVSTDPDFATMTEIWDIGNDTLPVWDFLYVENIPVDITANPGESIYLRIYPWADGATEAEERGRLLLKRIEIEGTTELPTVVAASDSVCWPLVKVADEDSWADICAGIIGGNLTSDSMRVYEEGNPGGALISTGDGTWLRRDGSWGIGGKVTSADPDSGRRTMRMSWQKEAIYPGEAAVGWPLNNFDKIENVYWQFETSPAPGYTFNASSISFDIGRGDDHPMKAKAFVSTDPDFATMTEIWDIGVDTLPEWEFKYVANIPVDVTAGDGESIYLRIYPWAEGATEAEERGRLLLKRVKIKGVASAVVEATESVCWPLVKVADEDSWADICAGINVGNVTSDSMRVYEEGNPGGAIISTGDGTWLRRDGSWGIGGKVTSADPDSGRRTMRMSWQKEAIYPGEAAVGWPLNNFDKIENVYWQFEASPAPGYKFNASSVSFDIGRGDDHPMKAKAFVSTDPDFATMTEIWDIGGDTLPEWEFKYVANIPVNISADPGKSIYLRIYPWAEGATEAEERGRLLLKRVKIEGVSEPTSVAAVNDSVWWPNIEDENNVLTEEVDWSAVYSTGNMTGDSMRVYQEGNPVGVVLESNDGTYLRRDGSWGIGGNAAEDPDAGTRAMRMSLQNGVTFPGETAEGWPLLNEDMIENIYCQFQATPKAGVSFTAKTVSFDIGALDDYMKAKAFISTDPDFASSTEIWYSDSILVKTDFDYIKKDVDITANSGESVFLRIYVWGDSLTEYETRGRVVLKRIKIKGSTVGEPEIPDSTHIIWVNSDNSDSVWVEKLVEDGYKVQVETGTMQGTLTAEQIETLNSGDVVIFSRANGSGDYNDPYGWNGITTPLILHSPYLARANRWQWMNSNELLTEGGAPPFRAEQPDHPMFEGVLKDATNRMPILDHTAGTGNTVFLMESEVGPEAEILATRSDSGTVAIVYWPTGATFHESTIFAASGPRVLFTAGMREGEKDGVTYLWGEYNLQDHGYKAFINAINWMADSLGHGDSSIVMVNVDDSEMRRIPKEFALANNYPNPFNPSTMISFDVPQKGNLSLTVYNAIGQEIVTLVNKEYQPGSYDVRWDGKDRFGNTVPGGVYIYQLRANGFTKSSKMLLLK